MDSSRLVDGLAGLPDFPGGLILRTEPPAHKVRGGLAVVESVRGGGVENLCPDSRASIGFLWEQGPGRREEPEVDFGQVEERAQQAC